MWLSLVSDLAQAYFELLALDVQLQIARDSAQAFQGTYDLFQDRLLFGLASKLQTARAEGALGGAQANIPELENQVVAKENQISILLGKAPAPIPRGTPMYGQPVVPTVPAGLPSTLLQRRPDLRQVEQQLVRANAQVGVAKAEFFPKLNLTGILGTASPEIAAITSGGSLVWAVAAGLTGPIFQGGRILQNYRATLAEREQAMLQYQQAVITALREVADGLTALAKLRDAEAGQDRSVKALQEAVALAIDRYRFGLASYYEVLEAQQQLFPAQQTLAQIRRDRLHRVRRALQGPRRRLEPQRCAVDQAERAAGKGGNAMMPRLWSSVDRAGRRAGLPRPHGRTEAVQSTVTVGRSAWTESRSGSRWPWAPAPWPRRFLSTLWPWRPRYISFATRYESAALAQASGPMRRSSARRYSSRSGLTWSRSLCGRCCS